MTISLPWCWSAVGRSGICVPWWSGKGFPICFIPPQNISQKMHAALGVLLRTKPPWNAIGPRPKQPKVAKTNMLINMTAKRHRNILPRNWWIFFLWRCLPSVGLSFQSSWTTRKGICSSCLIFVPMEKKQIAPVSVCYSYFFSDEIWDVGRQGNEYRIKYLIYIAYDHSDDV